MSEKPNSLKQAIQNMIPESIGLVEGVVVSISPLSVQIVNNPKMVVSGANLVVPHHLTNYDTTCTIAPCVPPVLSGEAGSVPLSGFGLQNAAITIYNALKIDDRVNMLRFNGGKQYYVLDRVVG